MNIIKFSFNISSKKIDDIKGATLSLYQNKPAEIRVEFLNGKKKLFREIKS